MSYVLKRYPVWLESLPIDRTGDALADLIGDSSHVSVPVSLLLAVSPLLRTMMTDILPPVYSPLEIVLPEIEEDALLIVQELMLKGRADMNEAMQRKVQEVFEILCIRDTFSWQDKFHGNVKNEVDYLECGQDSTFKSEINDKVEQEEEIFGVKWKGRVEEAGNSADMDSHIWESEKKEIIAQDMLNKRKRSMKKGQLKVFNCQECDYQCKSKSNLERHGRKHTGEKPFKCCLCNFETGYKRDLVRHNMRVHTEVKNYTCDNCEFKTAHKLDLKTHQRIHSGENSFSCVKCEFKTADKSEIRRHQKTHSVKIEVFVKLEQEGECQDVHLLNSENEGGSTAVIKQEERSSDVILKGQSNGVDVIVQPPAPNSDSILNRSCFKSADLKSQVGQSARKKVIYCFDMLNQRKKNFQKDRKKLFNCLECEYQSRFPSHLEKHIRKHTGEKPFKCYECEYKTGEKSNLLKHNKRYHAKDKHYKCANCEFKTAFKSDLERHQRIHSGVKHLKCDKCEYKTWYQFHLTRHQGTHSKAKPFSCERCDYKSNRKDHLGNHMKIHEK